MTADNGQAYRTLTPINDFIDEGGGTSRQSVALPPVQLPPGAPLGLAMLATARYRGVGAALRMFGSALDAATGVVEAATRYDKASMQNVQVAALWDQMPDILAHDARRVRRKLWLEEMKELHEIEDYLDQRTARHADGNHRNSAIQEEIGKLDAWIMGREEIVEAVNNIKEDIVSKRGGESNLTESDEEVFEDLDELASHAVRELRMSTIQMKEK